MEKDMIVLDEFCASHQVEISFIHSLEEQGLIETIRVNENVCVHGDELSKLEQILRFHELDINPEGIEVIMNLLHRIEELQHEVTGLRNKLNFYIDEK